LRATGWFSCIQGTISHPLSNSSIAVVASELKPTGPKGAVFVSIPLVSIVVVQLILREAFLSARAALAETVAERPLKTGKDPRAIQM